MECTFCREEMDEIVELALTTKSLPHIDCCVLHPECYDELLSKSGLEAIDQYEEEYED